MNTESLLEQMMRMELILLAGYFLLITVTLGNFIATGASAVHCVTKAPEEKKLAWLIAIIAVPLIGWICYWLNREKPTQSLPPLDTNYTPPPQTPADVAAAIAADLAKERNARRGQR